MNQASDFKFPSRHKNGVPPFSLKNNDPYIIFAKLVGEAGELLSTNTAWPDPLKYLDWEGRGVKVEVVGEGGQEVKITAQKQIKGFIFQEVRSAGIWSDNGFDVVPGEGQVVRFERAVSDGKWLRWAFLGA